LVEAQRRLELLEEQLRLPAIMPPKTKAISSTGEALLLRLKPAESSAGYFFFRTFGVVNSAGMG
jgi:hypothetical protein